MAASRVLEWLLEDINEALTALDLGSKGNVKLAKRTRDLKCGDIIIPSGCIDLDEPKATELLNHLERITSAHRNFITRVTRNKFSLIAFHLNRAHFCRAVFKEIQDGGDRYGHAKAKVDNCVFVNCANMTDTNNEISLADLRVNVVSCHVENLLEANGYSVISQSRHRNNLHKLMNSTKSSDAVQSCQQPLRPDQSRIKQQFVEKASQIASITNCSHQQHKHEKCDSNEGIVGSNAVPDDCGQDEGIVGSNAVPDDCGQDEGIVGSNAVPDDCGQDEGIVGSNVVPDDCGQDEGIVGSNAVPDDCGQDEGIVVENVVLDLKKIILDNDLCVGSGGFDKNLNKVTVVQNRTPTDIMQEAINLAEFLQSQQCSHCLHLISHQQAFRQQQIHLVLTALSDERVHQSFLVVGPVTPKQEETTSSRKYPDTAESLYKSRYLQMKEASEIRNADQSSDRQTQVLTSTSIKLDFLGNTSHTSLHVDASSTDRGAESRLGAFVLYNTARLATLMSHFTQGVQQGLYPPLPPVENIDCSLLREEEDWELVFLYLAVFPDIVRESVEVLFPTDGKCLAKIHTHRVTSFIVAFSKCLSAHYSRYHVLTGGQEHLLPLMYARLYVLKSAHQVLINSLQLVGVEALSFL